MLKFLPILFYFFNLSVGGGRFYFYIIIIIIFPTPVVFDRWLRLLPKLTNHEEGNGKVFPSGRPHGPEDCSYNCAADADEGDHDDEPADGNRLRHHHPATRLAALFAGVHRSTRSEIRNILTFIILRFFFRL